MLPTGAPAADVWAGIAASVWSGCEMTAGRGSDMELEYDKQQHPLLQLLLVTMLFRRGRVIGWTKCGKTVCACRQRLLLDVGSCNVLELSKAILPDACSAHDAFSGR